MVREQQELQEKNLEELWSKITDAFKDSKRPIELSGEEVYEILKSHKINELDGLNDKDLFDYIKTQITNSFKNLETQEREKISLLKNLIFQYRNIKIVELFKGLSKIPCRVLRDY